MSNVIATQSEAKGKQSLKPVYLLEGSESYLRDQWLSQLKAKILPKGMESLNFGRWVKGDNTLEEVLREAKDYPCMAAYRVCLLSSIDKADKKESAAIVEYLKRPVPTTVCILVSEGLDKRTSLAKTIYQTAEVIACTPLSDAEILRFIQAEFKQQGRSVSADAVQLIIEQMGNHLWAIKNFIAQVITYAGQVNAITASHVGELIFQVKEENIFDFVEAITMGEALKIEQRLKALVASGEAYVKILSLLLRHFNILLFLKEEGASEIQRFFPMPYAALSRYQQQVQQLGGRLHVSVIAKLQRLDQILKSEREGERRFRLELKSLTH